MSVNVTSSWMGMMTVRTLEITITDKTDSSQGSVDLVKLLTRAIWQVETDGQFIGNSNTGYRGDEPGFQSTKDKVAHYVFRNNVLLVFTNICSKKHIKSLSTFVKSTIKKKISSRSAMI